MDPLISIQLLRPGRTYQPCDVLTCEYQLDALDPAEITAVESSVLWYTEGKGDEDLSVHHFERRTPTDVIDGDLRSLRRIECQLPATPLSYHGFLFQIRWCVRVRVFLKGGREIYSDEVFQLGDIPAVPPPPVVEEEKTEAEAGAH
jgi:hypothetical protein